MTNETHVNPDVATGTSLNTKPVTAAKARAAKAGAHGKSKRKLDNAVTPTVAPTMPAPAPSKAKGEAKPQQGTAPTAMFHLERWPSDTAGPAPNDYEIARAYAFTHCQTNRPSKRVLAAASYLRPTSGQYQMARITDALWLTLGGDNGGGVRGDQMRNVCSDMLDFGYITKSLPMRGGAYQLTVTPKGDARWADFIKGNPAWAFENPYDAARAEAEAEAKAAKRAAALEKAKATREAKRGQKAADAYRKHDEATLPKGDHTMPRPEATVAAGDGNGDGAAQVPPALDQHTEA
jgi:hypothetical protein